MAQVTRMSLIGIPMILYGSFSGKTEEEVVEDLSNVTDDVTDNVTEDVEQELTDEIL